MNEKKLDGPFLWMGFTSRRQFNFITNFPETAGTHFINFGMMKGGVKPSAFEHGIPGFGIQFLNN